MLRGAGTVGVTTRQIEAALIERGKARGVKGALLAMFLRGELARKLEMSTDELGVFRQYRFWTPDTGPEDAERA